jgi:hypothetical protein
MIDNEIEKRNMIFDRKCEILENNLNLDFQTIWWEDCTERLFADPVSLDHVCYFLPMYETDHTLIMHGRQQLFNHTNLFRLIDEYFSRQ